VKPGINILWSYFYSRNNAASYDQVAELFLEAGWPLLLDSGGFSAFQLGKPIEVDDYIRYLLPRRHLFTGGYVALDIVSDAASTVDNLERMARAKLLPMPVMTQDMSLPQAQAINAISPSGGMCVSGGTHWADIPMMARYEAVHRLLPDVRLHGLGFTRKTSAARSNLFSADSSSWNCGTRYGLMQTWQLNEGVKQTSLRKIKALGWGRLPMRVRRAFEVCGITPDNIDEFLVDRTEGSWLNQFGIAAWLQFHHLMASKGKRLYLAIATLSHLIAISATQRTLELHGHIKYPDCFRIYEELRRLMKRDMIGFVRYITRKIDWSNNDNLFDSDAGIDTRNSLLA